GDLRGQSFLHLRAARVDVGDARQLRQPDDAPVFRNVGDVRDAGEGKQMVFTERCDGDVFDHHYLVVRFSRDYFDLTGRVFMQPAADLRIHLGHAAGRVENAGAREVLADPFQDQSHAGLDLL